MLSLEKMLASIVLGGAMAYGSPALAQQAQEPPKQEQKEHTYAVPQIPWEKEAGEKYKPKQVSKDKFVALARERITNPWQYCEEPNYYYYQHEKEGGDGGSQYDSSQARAIADQGFAMLKAARVGIAREEDLMRQVLDAVIQSSDDDERAVMYHSLDRWSRDAVIKAAWEYAKLYSFDAAKEIYDHFKEPLPRAELLALSRQALEDSKAYRAEEGFAVYYGRPLPGFAMLQLARAHLDKGRIDETLGHYAKTVKRGTRIPLQDRVRLYALLMRTGSYKNCMKDAGIMLPPEAVRARLHAQYLLARAFTENRSLQDVIECAAGDAPVDLDTLLQGAAVFDMRIDLKAYRKALFEDGSFKRLNQAAVRAGKPLTSEEIAHYVWRTLSWTDSPSMLHQAVEVLTALRACDPYYVLPPKLDDRIKDLFRDLTMESDDLIHAYNLLLPVDRPQPIMQFRDRAREQLEKGNYADALRATRYAGDIQQYNDMLLSCVMTIIGKDKAAAPYEFQKLLSSAMRAGDKDAAARLGEMLYDFGYNEQARDACRYAGIEQRARMAEARMLKQGIPIDLDHPWASK